MTIKKVRGTILAATGTLLLLGMSTPALAQDGLLDVLTGQDAAVAKAFERSNDSCAELNNRWCTSLQTSGITVRQYVEAKQILASSILQGNDWSEDILDEEIPVDKFFFVAANPT